MMFQRESRLYRIAVAEDHVLRLLFMRTNYLPDVMCFITMKEAEDENGLRVDIPEDTSIMSVFSDPMSKSFYFILHHPTFPPVADGDMIPHLKLRHVTVHAKQLTDHPPEMKKEEPISPVHAAMWPTSEAYRDAMRKEWEEMFKDKKVEPLQFPSKEAIDAVDANGDTVQFSVGDRVTWKSVDGERQFGTVGSAGGILARSGTDPLRLYVRWDKGGVCALETNRLLKEYRLHIDPVCQTTSDPPVELAPGETKTVKGNPFIVS